MSTANFHSKKLIKEAQDLIHQVLGSNGHVLVVEPTSNYRESIRQFFQNLGVRNIIIVPNIAEARRQFVIKDIRFVIAEWLIDGENNGLDFCRELRNSSQYKKIPYLLVTSENLTYDVMLAGEVGIDRYVLKPFSFKTFTAKIRSLLSRYLHPSQLDLKILEAESYLTYNDLERAESTYREAQKLDPKSGRAVVGLSRVYIKRNQLHHAQYLIKNGLALNPQHLDMHHLLLEIYKLSGNETGLLQQAKKLHSLSPSNPRYTLILADILLKERQIEASEKYFKKTLSISDKLAEAYKGIGELYIIKSNFKKAQRNLAKAISLQPNDVSSLNNLGLTLIKMGNYRSGIEKYLLALKIDPNNEKVLFNLGQAYEKQERHMDAIEYYSKALEKAPGYQKASKALERLKPNSPRKLPSAFAF